MPWSETSPLNERQRFIRDYRSGLYSMTELCLRFRVSRKTSYKWVRRFEEEGIEFAYPTQQLYVSGVPGEPPAVDGS